MEGVHNYLLHVEISDGRMVLLLRRWMESGVSGCALGDCLLPSIGLIRLELLERFDGRSPLCTLGEGDTTALTATPPRASSVIPIGGRRMRVSAHGRRSEKGKRIIKDRLCSIPLAIIRQ